MSEEVERPMTAGEAFALIVLIFFAAAAIAFTVWLFLAEGAWKMATEGSYDHVVYGQYEITHNSPSHRKETLDTTIVHFRDGRTCVMHGRHDMPFPKGTVVVIERNGMGRYRIQQK